MHICLEHYHYPATFLSWTGQKFVGSRIFSSPSICLRLLVLKIQVGSGEGGGRGLTHTEKKMEVENLDTASVIGPGLFISIFSCT